MKTILKATLAAVLALSLLCGVSLAEGSSAALAARPPRRPNPFTSPLCRSLAATARTA